MKVGTQNRGSKGFLSKVGVQQLFIPFPLHDKEKFLFIEMYAFLCFISLGSTTLFHDEISIQFLLITIRFRKHKFRMPEYAKIIGYTVDTIQRLLDFWKFYCTQKRGRGGGGVHQKGRRSIPWIKLWF